MGSLAFAALLKNKWTWRVLGGAVVASALAFGAHQLVEKGKREGAEQAKQGAQQEIERQHALAQADVERVSDEKDKEIQAAEARADVAAKDADYHRGRAQQFEQRVASARNSVASLPAAEAHAYTVKSLGLRTPEDGTPGYLPAEESAIAQMVAERPELAGQLAEMKATLAKQDEYISAVADKVAAIVEKDKARDEYTRQLEGWYAQLYNLHPPRKRSWKCVWLCRVDNKLGVPAPAEMKGKKP